MHLKKKKTLICNYVFARSCCSREKSDLSLFLFARPAWLFKLINIVKSGDKVVLDSKQGGKPQRENKIWEAEQFIEFLDMGGQMSPRVSKALDKRTFPFLIKINVFLKMKNDEISANC